jgi:putative ABC transport system permease protein
VLLSLLAIYALNRWQLTFSFGMQQNIPLAPSIAVTELLFIAGLVVLMALLASLQPAWKASRMDPVKALGHV